MDEIVMVWIGLFLIAVLVIVGIFTTNRLKKAEQKKQEERRAKAEKEWQAMEDEWEALVAANAPVISSQVYDEAIRKFETGRRKKRLEQVKLAQHRRMRMRQAKTLYRQPRNF